MASWAAALKGQDESSKKITKNRKKELADFGNIHYGYVSAAKGHSLEKTLAAAGFAQSFIQDPKLREDGHEVPDKRADALEGIYHMFTDMPGSAERRTKAGFSWGDNPDDPGPIM